MEDDQDHRPERHWACQCGRVFTSGQAYGGHLGHCKQQVGRAPVPVPVRASSNPTGSWKELLLGRWKEELEGSWSGSSTVVLGSSAITENSEAEDRNGEDQEDDEMNQGVNDVLPFDKMPQPNPEDPESTVKAYGGHLRHCKQQVNPAPAPVLVRASSSSPFSSGDQHGDQNPTGSRRELLLGRWREELKGSWSGSRTVVLGSSEADDRNREDQEDDKMNQGVTDFQLFDKMPQPNREDPESTVNSWNKRKLDDELKDHEFFCDICKMPFSSRQDLGEHEATHNFEYGASTRRAQAPPLDSGTGKAEGSRQFDLNEPPLAPVEDSQVKARSDSISE